MSIATRFCLISLSTIIAFICFVINEYDGIGVIAVLLFCFLYSQIGEPNSKSYRVSLYTLISLIYILSSLITSSCFSEVEYFLASDPTRYIEKVHHSTSYDLIWIELEKCYTELGDNNGLYNSILRLIGILCYKNGEIASSFLITLPQTLFGILTVQTVFRILDNFFVSFRAYRYTIIYGLCSLTLLYSGIIVRDIAIAFCFALCINIIVRPFHISGLLKLAAIMLICAGFRLFSGLFIAFFILYYILFSTNSKTLRVFIYTGMIVVLGIVAASAYVEQLFNQTSEEITGYSEWQSNVAGASDGFSGKLRELPAGFSNVALSLFSQMNPFPPYSTLMVEKLTLAQSYMGGLMMLSSIWWFYISYGLLYLLILKRGYKKLETKYLLLIAIAWILIVVSSTMHVDIRRLIPAYPIIYLMYLYIISYKYSKKTVIQMNSNLTLLYISLNILYLSLKW